MLTSDSNGFLTSKYFTYRLALQKNGASYDESIAIILLPMSVAFSG